MEKVSNFSKVALSTFVISLKDFFELDLSIKLFGVEVFRFTWPPKNPDDYEKL